MCGRFALATEKRLLEMLYQVEIRPDLEPRFNIAPSQEILGVRFLPLERRCEAAFFHWGFLPAWADESGSAARPINARAETAAEKPFFRKSFRQRRLLIPASGFFEWREEKGGKQPYYIRRRDGQPLTLGGLWDRWEKGAAPLESCAILTVAANELLAPIHHRMPLMISAADFQSWLEPPAPGYIPGPVPAADLIAYQVSRQVNNPANNDPTNLDPA